MRRDAPRASIFPASRILRAYWPENAAAVCKDEILVDLEEL